MKLTDIRQLEHLSPADRSAMYLKLGAELHKRPRKAPRSGTVPTAVDRETVMGTKLAPTIRVLHNYGGPEPQKVPGLRSTGRTLQTRRGPVPDLVLTPRERRAAVARAMSRDKDRSLNDLAIRQLVVGMMDSAPVSRSCAAYAYWQAVGAQASSQGSWA